MYINKLITRIIFFRNIYAIVCFIIYIDIENYRVKIIFDNEIEINYIFKKLVNET